MVWVMRMIADTIKALRQQSGFTQSELARKLNITRSSVNAWEMGISIPSTQFVVELARIFRVSTDAILGVSSKRTLDISSLTQEQERILLSILQYFNKVNEESG